MGNEIITAYCNATGAKIEDILNKKRDKKSLTVRNSLLVITWRRRKHRISRTYKKRHVLTEIGKEFGMSRINAYEQIDVFEANLAVSRELQQEFEEVVNKVIATYSPIDYSKKENQIGCGWCAKEKLCTIRDPKVNKAKQGCIDWQHWQDDF